jgi:hypothetical protein
MVSLDEAEAEGRGEARRVKRVERRCVWVVRFDRS